MDEKKPSRVLAVVVVLVGCALLLGGCASTIGFFGLPRWISSDDILGSQLGQMAGMFLGLVGGGLAVYHGVGSLRNRRSKRFRTIAPYFYWMIFALALGLGNLVLLDESLYTFLFPFLFLLGASMPVLAAVVWAWRRLGWPLTWRQAALSMVSGGTLSIVVAILLSGVVVYIYYLVFAPLEYMFGSVLDLVASSGPPALEDLIYSPLLIFFLVYVALQAPISEELAKALGPFLMGRRIRSERQAFAIGMASGAGFAILENMLYQGLYAQYSGWSWGGVTLLRGIGSLSHPLWTGIVALGLYRARQRQPGGFKGLLRAYFAAVGLHTLWNGGFDLLMYIMGIDYYSGAGRSISLYGEYVQVLLVVFLLVLTAAQWWILYRIVIRYSPVEARPEAATEIFSKRALAVWALACAMVIIPVGAALGHAWEEIRSVIVEGRVEESEGYFPEKIEASISWEAPPNEALPFSLH